MEQEGTAVYFKTSPLVAELTAAAAEEEGSSSLHYDRAEELLFNTTTTEAEFAVTALEVAIGNGGSRPLEGWWTCLLKWLGYSAAAHEEGSLRQAVAMVLASPLLTEEDHHLLTAALPVKEKPAQSIPSQSTRPSQNACPSLRAVVAFSVAVLAVCMAMGGLLLIGGAIATAGSIFATIRLASAVKCRQMNIAVSQLEDYLANFTTFISLVSQTTRTVQETEIISHGFARPSKHVPISRLEAHNHSLGCLVLRKRVLEACRESILTLRAATLDMCRQHPLCQELDDHHGYLAFYPLPQLHEHLLYGVHACRGSQRIGEEGYREDGDDSETDERRALGMESLKDASNLLAVQNSELLRRVALQLGVGGGGGLVALGRVLEQLGRVVAEHQSKLKWSLDFHKNCLFGDPPKRAVNDRSAGVVCGKQLTPLSEEIHYMDLRAQQLLQKVREIGVFLAEEGQQDSTEDFSSAVVEGLQEKLVLLQHDIDGITDHLEGGVSILHRLQEDLSPTHESLERHLESGSGGEDDSTGGTPLQASQQQQQQEDDSSEDEMIFEAYVPLFPAASGEDDDDGDERAQSEGDPQQQLGGAMKKEVPQHLLKELRSVLAVRGAERERKKQLKRNRRRENQAGNTPSVQQVSKRTSLTSKNDSVENENETTSHKSTECHDQSIAAAAMVGHVVQQQPSVIQSSIAQTVAALAAKRKPHRTEQVFQDDFSCSYEEFKNTVEDVETHTP